jgi:hypothetical protein
VSEPPPPLLGTNPLTAPAPAYDRVRDDPTLGAITLRRTSGIERAATILVSIVAACAVLRIVVAGLVVEDAQRYLDGLISGDELTERTAPIVLVPLVQRLTSIAALVTIMVWMHRITSNHRDVRRAGDWRPGWAIGGWFAPPGVFIIPFLMLREMWRASNPDAIGRSWDRSPVTPLLTVWFVLSLVATIMFFVPGHLSALSDGSEIELARQIVGGDHVGALVIDAVVNVVGAAVFVTVVRRLGRRHRRLTGEEAG